MIEREFIVLLCYTGVMIYFLLLTLKLIHYIKDQKDEFGSGAVGVLVFMLWFCYFNTMFYTDFKHLPLTMWLEWLESRGILYSSDIFK